MRQAIALAICALALAALSAAAAALSWAGTSASVLMIQKGDFVAFDGTQVVCFVYGPAGAVPGASGILCTPGKVNRDGTIALLHEQDAGLITMCCVGTTSRIEFGELKDFIDIHRPILNGPYGKRTFHVPVQHLVRLRGEHAGSTLACSGRSSGPLDRRPHVVCLIVTARTVKLIPSGIVGYYYSGTKPVTGVDKQHHEAFVVYGETGLLVDLYEADAIHIPRNGSPSINYRWTP